MSFINPSSLKYRLNRDITIWHNHFGYQCLTNQQLQIFIDHIVSELGISGDPQAPPFTFPTLHSFQNFSTRFDLAVLNWHHGIGYQYMTPDQIQQFIQFIYEEDDLIAYIYNQPKAFSHYLNQL